MDEATLELRNAVEHWLGDYRTQDRIDRATAALAEFDKVHGEEAAAMNVATSEQIAVLAERGLEAWKTLLVGKKVRDTFGSEWVVSDVTWDGDQYTASSADGHWEDAEVVEVVSE